MSKWIEFVPVDNAGRLTKIWKVVTKDGAVTLGVVKWFTNWRKYSFYPATDTIFEEDCLGDIREFLKEQTKLHRSLGKLHE
jgi:hypothetical protein